MLSSAASPGGSNVIITGPRYMLGLTGVMTPPSSTLPTAFFLDPATMAQRIGGTIVTAAPSPAGSPS